MDQKAYDLGSKSAREVIDELRAELQRAREWLAEALPFVPEPLRSDIAQELSGDAVSRPSEIDRLKEQLGITTSTLDCVAMLTGTALAAILTSDAQRLRAEKRRAEPPPEGE